MWSFRGVRLLYLDDLRLLVWLCLFEYCHWLWFESSRDSWLPVFMSFPWTSFSTNGERKLVPTKMITSVYFHNKSCIFLGIIHVSPNLQLLLSSVETDLALSSVERQHGREHCFKERPAVVSGDNLGNGVVSGILRLGNYYSLPHAVFDYNRHVHSIQQYIIYIYISISIMIIDYWLIEHDVWFGR